MNKYKFIFIIAVVAFSFGGFTGQVVFGEILPEIEVGTETLVQYIDHNQKYTSRYPATWRAYEIPSMSYVRFESMDADSLNLLSPSERNNYFKIEVVTLPNQNNLSLKEWVEKQNTTSYPLPKVLEQKDIEVGGQPALYQIEQFGSLVHPAIFIAKGSSIYIINISPNTEVYKETVDDFLKNFQFNS